VIDGHAVAPVLADLDLVDHLGQPPDAQAAELVFQGGHGHGKDVVAEAGEVLHQHGQDRDGDARIDQIGMVMAISL